MYIMYVCMYVMYVCIYINIYICTGLGHHDVKVTDSSLQFPL